MRQIVSSSRIGSEVRQTSVSSSQLQVFNDLVFEEWEKKLPWVKEYQKLLLKPDLLVGDCDVLPTMRNDALVVHKQWSQNQVSPLAPEIIEKTFQTAVNNIVSRFCEPIEARYVDLVERLTKQAPERSAHEQFTDELKESYVKAVAVRQKATTTFYNPQSRMRSFAKKDESVAAVDFEQQKEAVRVRYLDIIKQEKSVLQVKFSELQESEATLRDVYTKNTDTINELEKEVKALLATLSKKAVELSSPMSVVVSGPHVGHTQLAPPPPPPPPPALSPKTASAAVSVSPFKNVGVMGKASFRSDENATKPINTMQSSSALLGSLVGDRGLSRTEPKSPDKLAASHKRKIISIEEEEIVLEKQAEKICIKEQVILAMKQRNELQPRIIMDLKRAKTKLMGISSDLDLLEAKREEAKRQLSNQLVTHLTHGTN